MNMDEIKNFATLKAVVEDMQARRSELGIEGVFAATSLAQGGRLALADTLVKYSNVLRVSAREHH